MSRLYPYFEMCWTTNLNFTAQQLETAVAKEYITANEKVQIAALQKAE